MHFWSFIGGAATVIGIVGFCVFRGYISLGKGERADKVDDDFKAARDKVSEGVKDLRK
jgi:hypothetical protein